MGKGALDSDARYSQGCHGVNPARPDGMRRVLPREVCPEVIKKRCDKDGGDATRMRGGSQPRSWQSALGDEGPNLSDQKHSVDILMHRKKPEKTDGDGGQAKRPGRPMPRFVPCGDGATESAGDEEFPKCTAIPHGQPLTEQLMERVTAPANMNRAYRRVVSNKGAAGVDRMTVSQLREWIDENGKLLLESPRNGTYQPQVVLGVEIPKPNGGKRQLASRPWWTV